MESRNKSGALAVISVLSVLKLFTHLFKETE